MKYKDVENKIKRAADDMDVPDLLTRVKKAPLKGMMLSGRPSVVFRRRAVIALLTLTLAIFAVMSIALFAYGICL